MKEQTIGQLKLKIEALNEFKDNQIKIEEQNEKLKEDYTLLEEKYMALYESMNNPKEGNNNQIEDIRLGDYKNKKEIEEFNVANLKLEEANKNLKNENILLAITLNKMIIYFQKENPKILDELQIPNQVYTIIEKIQNQSIDLDNSSRDQIQVNQEKGQQIIDNRNNNFIKDLEKTLSVKNKSINEYKIHIEALKSSKESILQENEMLKKKNDELEQKLSEVDIEYNKKLKENEIFKLRLDIAKRQLEAINDSKFEKDVNEKLKIIIDDGYQKNSQFIEVLKGYQNKTQELSSQFNKLQREYKEYVSFNLSPIKSQYNGRQGSDRSEENEIYKLRNQLQYAMKEYRELRIMYEKLVIETNENHERFLSSKLALADENTNFKVEQDRLEKALKALTLDYNQLFAENETLKLQLTKIKK